MPTKPEPKVRRIKVFEGGAISDEAERRLKKLRKAQWDAGEIDLTKGGNLDPWIRGPKKRKGKSFEEV